MCPEIEGQLKPNLRGFFGGMIRVYLSQAWVFTTERETVTLNVDTEGSVAVRGGPTTNPDLIIQGTQGDLFHRRRGGQWLGWVRCTVRQCVERTS